MAEIPDKTIRDILDEIIGPELPFKQKTEAELQAMLDERQRQADCTICRGIYEDGTCQACGKELSGPSSIHERY
ncbi:unnamed protein product [marine sediment metagenome]|uniref:Uncharacterized protein n=1 Tax=marine sediment metagenome TaxID=412755 RepID=X0T3X3_9ZZZZ